MSDPCRSGFTCCNAPMTAVTWELTVEGSQVCAWICHCSVWRHRFAPQETQLRALAAARVADVLAQRIADEREQVQS